MTTLGMVARQGKRYLLCKNRNKNLTKWHLLSFSLSPFMLSLQGTCFPNTGANFSSYFASIDSGMFFSPKETFPQWELHTCINGGINVPRLKFGYNLLICRLYNSAVRILSLQKTGA